MNNNVDANALSGILSIALGVAFSIFIILFVILIVLKFRDTSQKKEAKKNEEIIGNNNNKNKNKNKTKTSSEYKQYNKQSIYDFMEFDKVEDNMIVQKNGRRYLMVVVECQGINYDLMSKVEKVGVEEGFQQFLNTLRHPIQIYIQTRTVNLEGCIAGYKTRIKEIENRYNQMTFQYNQMRESETYSQSDLDEYWFELTKQRNLLEYGRDIISNTEKMSLNKNILNKKYFIIIPYFVEENTEKYDKEEIRNIAFSELYTNAQAIIRTLFSCSVSGKILSSKELIELLYVAYNRDDSEVLGIDKALIGYEDLYSTSVDVYEKKVKALDEMIHDKAIDLANETIEKVRSRPEQVAKEREDNLDELIRKMAALVIKENASHVGEDVAEEAIKEIESDEGGDANEKVQKKATRTRNAKAVNE